jgi:hypothetical protein
MNFNKNILKKFIIKKYQNFRGVDNQPNIESIIEMIKPAIYKWRNGDTDEAYAILMRTLIYFEVDAKSLGSSYLHILLESIAEVHADASIQNKFIDNTKKVPVHALKTSEWMILFNILMLTGNFRTAMIARQNAVKRAKEFPQTKKLSFWDIKNLFNAAIETGDISTAKKGGELLEGFSKGFKRSSPFSASKILTYLESGQAQFINGKFSFSKDDFAFRELIEGKSIAVVGPSPTNEKNGAEIDSFDIVVKEGHIGMQNSDYQGNRIDISYYGGSLGRNYLSKENFELPANMRFAVFYDKHHCKVAKRTGIPTRAPYFFPWIFNGSFNGILNTIWDLIPFQPKIIKIFNATLYIPIHNKMYLNEEYRDQIKKQRNINWGRKFATHDILTNFYMLKDLIINRELVTADRELMDILSMSNIEFVSILEKSYQQSCININNS